MSDYERLKRLLKEIKMICEYLDMFAKKIKTNSFDNDIEKTSFNDGVVSGLDYARKKFSFLIEREISIHDLCQQGDE